MITLYSTGCPKCKALERQLEKSKIEYELVTDRDVMINKGFTSAPKLEMEGKVFDFPDAMRWILNQEVK